MKPRPKDFTITICSYLETYGSAEEKVVYQELGTSTIWLAGRSVSKTIFQLAEHIMCNGLEFFKARQKQLRINVKLVGIVV